MDVFRRIFLVAGLAGLAAGLLLALVHLFGTVPLIHTAETYETAAASDMAMAGHEHEHDDEGWQPADGLERTALTVLADLLTAIGFALLLVAAYTLIAPAGMDWHRGLLWGLAGFAAFTLAPGLGLPPELPGTEAAPLLARQAWWLATVLATGGGLGLILLGRTPATTALGLLLLAAPHLYGAPQPAEAHSAAPEALAHAFATAATVTSLLFWAALGSLTGHLYQRFPPEPDAGPARGLRSAA